MSTILKMEPEPGVIRKNRCDWMTEVSDNSNKQTEGQEKYRIQTKEKQNLINDGVPPPHLRPQKEKSMGECKENNFQKHQHVVQAEIGLSQHTLTHLSSIECL